MISEPDILNCFKHLVEASIDDDQLVVGSGDDAAVIKSNTKDLVHSLDVSTVSRHFPKDSDPKDIAYRSISTALSDLAAMGAYPSFISIGLTADLKDIQWYKNFTIGTEQILKDFNIKLVGGDITYGELNICVNVFGYPYKKPLTRSNAQIGDDIYITGKLGLARQGLKDFNSKKKSEFINYYFKPKPEFKKSELISPFASSCIDISDGLLKDLKTICSQSNVGATIDYEKIPIHNDMNDLTYGDDYVLCFTTSKKNSDNFHEPDFYKIGQITNKKDVEIKKNNKKLEFDKNGWDSFE